MKTKKLLLTCIVILSVAEGSFSQSTWTSKAPLPAVGRMAAVAFSIGSKGYLGTGRYPTSPYYLNDFWEYDPAINSWTQKANFGGAPRNYAVGFSIGNKGYLGTGWSDDFWQYDPVANSWTQVANFGGGVRTCASGFSIGGFGYVGTGAQNGSTGPIIPYTNGFWKYDPVANNWTQLGNFLGAARSDIDRAAFIICNKAYWGTGFNGGTVYRDLWEYDPVTDTWTQKANLPGAARVGAIGFSVSNKGFLGLGAPNIIANTCFNDLWMYDPATNSWSAAPSLPASGRCDAQVFVVNNKAYVGTGLTAGGLNYLVDLWEFTPDSAISGGGNVTAVIVSSTDTICLGQSVTLSASGGGNYSWSNGSANNPIVVSPTATTTYSVIVTDTTACGGSGMAAVTISLSNITAGIPIVANTNCDGQCTGSATASANGGAPAYTYSWSTVPIQNTPTATGLCVGIYTCTITDANGCTGNVTVTVAEIPCPCPNLKLTVPNAFSPNSDGENDEFCLQGGMDDCIKELKIIIYDRWGEKVYESTDKNFCWDGIYQSKLMNSAVFVYYMEATLISEETITKKGNVSLVR